MKEASDSQQMSDSLGACLELAISHRNRSSGHPSLLTPRLVSIDIVGSRCSTTTAVTHADTSRPYFVRASFPLVCTLCDVTKFWHFDTDDLHLVRLVLSDVPKDAKVVLAHCNAFSKSP